MQLSDRIRAFEAAARALEPDRAARDAGASPFFAYASQFLDTVNSMPAFQGGDGRDILQLQIREEGRDPSSVLQVLQQSVDTPGLNPASGGHLGYIPGGGIYYSALGDFLADVTNRYAGVYYAGPGAVRMENLLIRWLAEILEMPAGSAGNLTSGGSIANLVGVVTARESCGVRAADIPRSVIYCTTQAHHSVDKAIRIAGLSECVRRNITMDEGWRMDTAALDRAIVEDQQNGLRPFLIIASAGTTDTGAIDPLADIATIARRRDCWFHVDAAYGGFFILTGKGRRKLTGIGSADSLVIDPHKGLFLPYGLGAALVRDRTALHAAHYYQANYMQDASAFSDEDSPAELSPELTKPFRGLRLWLPLQLHGVAPFRACLEEKLLLARYFYEGVRTLGFETGPAPDLSVVTYRFLPPRGDADEFNRKLIQRIVKDGRVFISSTLLHGKFTLRFACLSFRTHLDTVELLLELLKLHTQQLLKD